MAGALRYRAPAGVAGVALVFWGAVTGHWIVGVLLGVMLEARLIVRSRW